MNNQYLKITLLSLFSLLLSQKVIPASPEIKNVYTLVDGVLLAPSSTAHTIDRNQFRLGLSTYYYRLEKSENSILYNIGTITETNHDAILNFSIEYGILDNTEISFVIPYAPDWQTGEGSNRGGLTDIVFFLKQYLTTIFSVETGFCFGIKTNTGTYHNNPHYYGTDNSNLFIRYIVSTNFRNLQTFLNLGFKKNIGSTERKGAGIEFPYSYADTFIGSFGFMLPLTDQFHILSESNFESHNKCNYDGYYLDFCNGVLINTTKNFQMYCKLGINISEFAPSYYISTGTSISFKPIKKPK